MQALDPAARRALASLLAFWAEAGVDATYADAPVDRLAAPPPRAKAAPPGPAPTVRAVSSAPVAPGLAEEVAAACAAAAAADTLPALAEAAASFAAARGIATAPDLLLRASPDAVVAWIVEAPDADDLAAGRLLAGPRGRLLEAMLAAAGLGDRALILAAAPRIAPATGGPNVADAARHLPFVERALALGAPVAAVLAGSGALRAVTGADEPILKAHGRLRDWTGPHFGAALPVMPTFSLETLLAQPPAKARAWRDILALLAHVDLVVPGP